MAASITPHRARDALSRVLASERFRNSPRLSRFLDYIVEASLTGEATSLKEYTIGVDVFDKPLSFGPQTDSTVRAEASKLRLKLRLYYETEGREEPVRIEIPKGGYRAEFHGPPKHPRSRRTAAWVCAGLAL